jgi:2-methylcitrate dehydratase PrpD
MKKSIHKNEFFKKFDFDGGKAVIDQLYQFCMKLKWDDIPESVQHRVKNLFLDLIGVLTAGRKTPVSQIIKDFAVSQLGAGDCKSRLLLDGHEVSPSGAALVRGMTIDSIDAHDGHYLAKGHVGCACFSALLAYADDLNISDGGTLLTSLVIGYEIGTRAGRILHESPETSDQYYSSGSWVAVACAAMGARLMNLDIASFQNALAIAEYHAPRSPVMKVANHPTMLKDASGWGAMAGVSAAYLARGGFTAAPVIMAESKHLQSYWLNLGDHWETLNQYVKPHPVCRWTQDPIEAVEKLLVKRSIDSKEIVAIVVETFEEATLLSREIPKNTEQAQYNVPFPLAVMLVRGKIDAFEITDQSVFSDPEIRRLTNLIDMQVNEKFNALFPKERWAQVRITLSTGEVLESPPTKARGEPDTMLSDIEFREKFKNLASIHFSSQECDTIIRLVENLGTEIDDWLTLRSLLK